MKPQSELENRFSKLGGVFVTPVAVLAERVRTLRGVVCDWDGVFNQGAKGEGAESTFSESDSMGTNLLRYALWRASGQLPVAALITGADNPSARSFALREHFHAVYYGVRNKTVAIEALCRTHQMSSEQLVCFFDDVNDLGAMAIAGLSAAPANARPEVLATVAFRSAAQGGDGAVRELIDQLFLNSAHVGAAT